MGDPGARWFADWEGPAGADVSFRFRSSADASAWNEWTDRPDDGAAFTKVRIEMRPAPGGASPVLREFGFR